MCKTSHRHVVLFLTVALVLAIAGRAALAAPSAATSPLQCVDAILDGGHEAGYWRDWTPVGDSPFLASYWSHGGQWSAAVGGGNDVRNAYYQDVTIPAGATGATLSFWWRIYTEEGGIGTPTANDWFQAVMTDSLGVGHVLEELSNLADASGWHQTTVDLDPLEFGSLYGATSRLAFSAVTDEASFTSFYVDDVELLVCGATTATSTPTDDGGECPLDEWEDNDSFETASNLVVSGEAVGYICPNGDEDWYALELSAGQTVSITLTGAQGGDLPADFDITLYTPTHEELAFSAYGGGATEAIAYGIPVSGVYRVSVIGYQDAWSETAYLLTATLVTCPVDEWEDNDDFETASDFIVSGEAVGYVCPAGDEDWYALDLSAGQAVSITLTGTEGGDLPANFDITLYTPTHEELAFSAYGGGATEAIAYDIPVSGVYRVSVIGYQDAWSETAYLLSIHVDTVTPTPTATLGACPIDEYEVNDDFASAYHLLSEDLADPAYICPAGDEDWYLVSLSAGERLTATLTGPDGGLLGADFDLYLFDPAEQPIDSSRYGSAMTETLRYTATTTGDYALAVEGYEDAWSTTHYELRITRDTSAVATPTTTATPSGTPSVTTTPTCQDDTHEDNDTWQAAPIVWLPFLEDPLVLCPHDSDYYGFAVSGGERLHVDLGFRHADGDLDLVLLDSNGLTVRSSSSTTDDEAIVYDVAVTDRYYVGVQFGTHEGRGVEYALSIQTTQPPSATPTRTYTPTTTRTPTSTQTPTRATPTPTRKQVDLTIMAIEATQGLQNWANDIPLVADKSTYLRVVLNGEPHPWTAVGDVYATLDGVALSPSSAPLRMITMSASPGLLAKRKDPNKTMSCYLPRSWLARAGSLALRVEVMPQGADDPHLTDNTRTLTIPVETSPPMHIQAVQVRDGGFLGWGAKGPEYSEYKDIHHLAEHLYPVARIQMHPHKHSIPWLTGPLTLVALAHVDLLDRDPGPNTVIMGMVRDEAWAPFAGGQGLPNRHCWVKINWNSPFICAHEAGHGFGMLHVNDGKAHWPWEPFPYPVKQISWGTQADYWGTDLRWYPPHILPGDDYADLMSYTSPFWISDYTYMKLRRVLRAALSGELSSAGLYRQVRPLVDTEYLMALGTIAADGGGAQIVTTLRVAGDDLDPEAKTSPDGAYRLQLLAADDSLLDEVTFGPPEGNHQEEDQPWSVIIPWHPNTARVVVRDPASELATESVSPHAPEVTWDPVANVVTDTLVCTWTATDADGDDLSTTLMFSADNGQTYSPVAVGIEGARHEAGTLLWPETNEARLRLLVSDGLNTTEAESDAFSVPVRGPMAYIVAPEDGAIVEPGSPVSLRATGYDAEDGPLGEGDYDWSSDVDGTLGKGEVLVAEGLSRGWHTLTLTANDSDEHTTTDTITLLVGYDMELPVIMH